MELWKSMGWEWKFTWCGVGTRDVAPEHQPILIWVGECMTLLGGVLCTGDAIGSDELFYRGVLKATPQLTKAPPPQIYYTRLKNQRNLQHNPLVGHHEAEQYDTFEEAQAIAFRARGSFEGLFPSGIGLHTRNAFQVLGETLQDPRWITVFYAQPANKKGTRWHGGTNTAVQISIQNGIKIVNLYVEEDRNKFIDWLKGQLTKQGLEIPVMSQETRHA